jgi:hypothetical protein
LLVVVRKNMGCHNYKLALPILEQERRFFLIKKSEIWTYPKNWTPIMLLLGLS